MKGHDRGSIQRLQPYHIIIIFYDYYTGVNFTFSYIFYVIPCTGYDPKNYFNKSNMDFWNHSWCVENNSCHLTRSLLLPFPRTSLQGPACWPVHHTACPQVHKDGQGQLNLVPSSGHNNTSAMKVLVVTRELQYKLRRLKSAEISFLHIQKM